MKIVSYCSDHSCQFRSVYGRLAFAVLAALVVAVMSLASVGCTQAKPAADGGAAPADVVKPKVTVTTSFLSDMVKQLAGDVVQIDQIIPAGEDPHLYVAKPSDAQKLAEADLVLYHGLHFEGKMVEALEKTGRSVSRDFDQSQILTMEEDGESVIDPHFWFDINLYKQAVKTASADLQQLAPNDAQKIAENEKNYLAALDKLYEDNKAKLSQIPEESRVLVTPHDAFNYFSRMYNIEVVAPQGVSTDSEVANADLGETAKLIADKKIKAIFVESTTDPARMKKLQELVKADGFDVKVVSGEGKELFSDSLAPLGEKGDTYIDMYQHDVDLIVDNLK